MAATGHTSNKRTHQNVCPIMLSPKYCKRWQLMHICLIFMMIYTTMQISPDSARNKFGRSQNTEEQKKQKICVQNEAPKWSDMSSRNKVLQHYFQSQNVKKLREKKSTKSNLSKSAQPWMHTFTLCVEFSHSISSVI